RRPRPSARGRRGHPCGLRVLSRHPSPRWLLAQGGPRGGRHACLQPLPPRGHRHRRRLARPGANPARRAVPVGAGAALARPARPVALAIALVALVGTGAFLVVPAAGAARAITFPAELPHVVPSAVPGGLSNPSLGDDDPARPSRRGRSGGGRASFGYFGFSTSLDTSVRGRPDDTLVMRVRASAPDRWRGQTFDH